MTERRRARGVVLALLVVCIGSVGCQAPSSQSTAIVSVVTTSTVFGDLIVNVGGDLVKVTSLVPRNGDVHTFEPKPSDMRTLATADLVVMNGLGLDDWIADALTTAAPKDIPVLRLGEGLIGVELLPGDTPGTQNPHLWMDVTYAQAYARQIADALAEVDPAHEAAYGRQVAVYHARLSTLHDWVREQMASIPPNQRRIVTYHDAFPYFARAYGLQIVGVAVPAPGQDPSAGYTADLIEAIRDAGVRAIVSEAQFPAALVNRLAEATGAAVVADLYDDSLGDPPINSYEAIIRWDTEQLVDALR